MAWSAYALPGPDQGAIATLAAAATIQPMKAWLRRTALTVFGVTLVVTVIGFSRAQVLSHLMATDRGSPGTWRLDYQPDWLAVGIAALATSVVATCLWMVVARLVFRRGPQSIGPYLMTGVLVAAALGVAGLFPTFGTISCDGSVPRWMLPSDYNGGGCIPWPENASRTQPWDGQDMVCLGLCSDPTLPYR